MQYVFVTGQLAEAAENFELCYSLTKGKTDWITADGDRSMHSQSCGNLTRIYTSIASHYSEQNDQETSLQFLVRAYDKSREGKLYAITNWLLNYNYNSQYLLSYFMM